MRDFVGMEAVDEATRHALVDFSYYLTIGNLDEAHKAVKVVPSPVERRWPLPPPHAEPAC